MILRICQFFVLASALLLSGLGTYAAFAADSSQVQWVRGTVFERDSNLSKELYKYEKKITISDGKRSVYGKYITPEGNVALEEKVSYNSDGTLNEYWRMQHQVGEETRAIRKGEKVFFEKKQDGDVDQDEEDWEPNFVTTEQIHEEIKKNWQKLVAGEELEIRLIVPARTETVGFDIERVDDRTWQGRPAYVFKMSAGSMIIRAIVDPVYFYYEKDDQKQRMYMVDGRTPMKVKKADGSYGGDLDAHFVIHHDDDAPKVAKSGTKSAKQ